MESFKFPSPAIPNLFGRTRKREHCGRNKANFCDWENYTSKGTHFFRDAAQFYCLEYRRKEIQLFTHFTI